MLLKIMALSLEGLKQKNKEIKSKEAMDLLGLKPNTFYNMVSSYNQI